MVTSLSAYFSSTRFSGERGRLCFGVLISCFFSVSSSIKGSFQYEGFLGGVFTARIILVGVLMG